MSDGISATRALVIALAAVLVAVAVAFLVAPGVLPAGLRRTADEIGDEETVRRLLVLGGFMVAVYGVFSLWVWRAPERSGWFTDRTPETPDRDVRVAGSDLTAAFAERSVGEGVEGTADDGPLGGTLRAALCDRYEREASDRAAAERYVDLGEWTDDRYAAAFVTDTEAADYPLGHRLYAWLYPGRAYEYRARRALAATEAACAEHAVGYDPPERSAGTVDRVRGLVARSVAGGGTGHDSGSDGTGGPDSGTATESDGAPGGRATADGGVDGPRARAGGDES